MYGLIVILVNVKILLFSYSFYWFNTGLIFLSIVFYFFTTQVIDSLMPISEFLNNFDIRGSVSMIISNPNSYIIILLVTYMSFFLQPIANTLSLLRKKSHRVDNDKELSQQYHRINTNPI